ncbi:MAG TPA: DivIVA domain-containing protein [Candidatus Faecousia gallistercoris]|nr:DivIVA domain-containing protein [Candidatus Faecousia gallistercoris]
MFTPQQLEQITFKTAVFGGYDMDSVDETVTALIEDYNTLYKDNATLKSKMRVLVEKLEEYRAGESSAKESLRTAQQTCDNMIREAEAKCLRMLHRAEAQASQTGLSQAKAAALEGIESLEGQLKEVLEKLEAIKAQAAEPAPPEIPQPQSEDQVAQEIAQNLEKLVGTTEDTAPVTHPPRVDGNTTSRFTNLQFGKNYDPTKR